MHVMMIGSLDIGHNPDLGGSLPTELGLLTNLGTLPFILLSVSSYCCPALSLMVIVGSLLQYRTTGSSKYYVSWYNSDRNWAVCLAW